MGGWRYGLPPAMQEAIREGEEVFTRLVARLAIAPASKPISSRIQELRAKVQAALLAEPGIKATAVAAKVGGRRTDALRFVREIRGNQAT